MKKFKKVLLVVSVVLIAVFSLAGCRELTECRYCDRMKYCKEIGVDGEAEMVCGECAEKMGY